MKKIMLLVVAIIMIMAPTKVHAEETTFSENVIIIDDAQTVEQAVEETAAETIVIDDGFFEEVQTCEEIQEVEQIQTAEVYEETFEQPQEVAEDTQVIEESAEIAEITAEADCVPETEAPQEVVVPETIVEQPQENQAVVEEPIYFPVVGFEDEATVEEAPAVEAVAETPATVSETLQEAVAETPAVVEIPTEEAPKTPTFSHLHFEDDEDLDFENENDEINIVSQADSQEEIEHVVIDIPSIDPAEPVKEEAVMDGPRSTQEENQEQEQPGLEARDVSVETSTTDNGDGTATVIRKTTTVEVVKYDDGSYDIVTSVVKETVHQAIDADGNVLKEYTESISEPRKTVEHVDAPEPTPEPKPDEPKKPEPTPEEPTPTPEPEKEPEPTPEPTPEPEVPVIPEEPTPEEPEVPVVVPEEPQVTTPANDIEIEIESHVIAEEELTFPETEDVAPLVTRDLPTGDTSAMAMYFTIMLLSLLSLAAWVMNKTIA